MEVVPYETRLRQDRIWARKQVDSFFRRGGPYKTLEDLQTWLETTGIPYAVVGRVAVGERGVDRQTAKVEILTTKEGLAAFRERSGDLGYVPAFPGARESFQSTATGVTVEFYATGKYPGDGRPKSIAFPDPDAVSERIDGIPVIRLEKLIELSLASGRLGDLVDIQELIRHAKLPASLADSLDESVRQEYLDSWRIGQVPDVHNEEPPSS